MQFPQSSDASIRIKQAQSSVIQANFNITASAHWCLQRAARCRVTQETQERMSCCGIGRVGTSY